MIALDIMLVALAQSAVSTTPPSAGTVPRPDVEVVGPQPRSRVICRIITPSNSRIPARRICETHGEAEARIDRAQAEAGADVRSTDRREREMLENSGQGNWIREHRQSPIGQTDVRQERRGGD